MDDKRFYQNIGFKHPLLNCRFTGFNCRKIVGVSYQRRLINIYLIIRYHQIELLICKADHSKDAVLLDDLLTHFNKTDCMATRLSDAFK